MYFTSPVPLQPFTDLLGIPFPLPLSLSLSCFFCACTSCVLCFGLHANCSQKSCLLCAHQTFSVGKRLSIQIECNTFWLNCMRVGLSAKSLDFHRLKLVFRVPVEWEWEREWNNERVTFAYVEWGHGEGVCVACGECVFLWDLICQSLCANNAQGHNHYRKGQSWKVSFSYYSLRYYFILFPEYLSSICKRSCRPQRLSFFPVISLINLSCIYYHLTLDICIPYRIFFRKIIALRQLSSPCSRYAAWA